MYTKHEIQYGFEATKISVRIYPATSMSSEITKDNNNMKNKACFS